MNFDRPRSEPTAEGNQSAYEHAKNAIATRCENLILHGNVSGFDDMVDKLEAAGVQMPRDRFKTTRVRDIIQVVNGETGEPTEGTLKAQEMWNSEVVADRVRQLKEHIGSLVGSGRLKPEIIQEALETARSKRMD